MWIVQAADVIPCVFIFLWLEEDSSNIADGIWDQIFKVLDQEEISGQQ